MDFQLDSACISHIGSIRKANEDNFLFNGSLLEKDNTGTGRILTDTVNDGQDSVYAVFDGMGGETMGELASYLAAEQLDETLKKKSSFAGAEKFLSYYAYQANDRICKIMREGKISRMGTTAAIVYIKNDIATIMNIGDSRVYMLEENDINILSVDHTDDSLMKQSGVSGKPKLTQHLGIFPEEMIIEPHIESIHITEGNRILICSDGLYNSLTNDDIRDFMSSGKTPHETVELIINEALRRGSNDNVTVILIDIKRK